MFLLRIYIYIDTESTCIEISRRRMGGGPIPMLAGKSLKKRKPARSLTGGPHPPQEENSLLLSLLVDIPAIMPSQKIISPRMNSLPHVLSVHDDPRECMLAASTFLSVYKYDVSLLLRYSHTI